MTSPACPLAAPLALCPCPRPAAAAVGRHLQPAHPRRRARRLLGSHGARGHAARRRASRVCACAAAGPAPSAAEAAAADLYGSGIATRDLFDLDNIAAAPPQGQARPCAAPAPRLPAPRWVSSPRPSRAGACRGPPTSWGPAGGAGAAAGGPAGRGRHGRHGRRTRDRGVLWGPVRSCCPGRLRRARRRSVWGWRARALRRPLSRSSSPCSLQASGPLGRRRLRPRQSTTPSRSGGWGVDWHCKL